MSTQYLRKVSLLVAPASGEKALDLSEFRFTFLVQRGDTQTPNSISLRVYNLSRETEHRLQNAPTSEFSRMVLQVGYEGLPGEQPYLGTIFDGNIKYANRGNEDAKNSFLEIVAADGDAAYNFAYVNLTLAVGSTASDHVNAYVSSMEKVLPDGVTKGYIPDFEQTLPRGKVMFGLTRDYLRNTAASVQTTWSIQDGQLQLIPLSSGLPEQAVQLNSATGLIGFPQRTTGGIQVRSLINPLIKIGGLIEINNSYIQGLKYSLAVGGNTGLGVTEAAKLNYSVDDDGFYRVLWIEHTGDTRGNQWYSDIICVAVDSSYVDVNKIAVSTSDSPNIPAR